LGQEAETPTGYVRFEVFTAVTMKNAVFWNIKAQFVPHRRHYVSATEPNLLLLYKILRCFTAVTMKNAVFWVIKTQFVPHRKHYVSATEPSLLKLYKV
jgi:site-specific DNA-adenine methylase